MDQANALLVSGLVRLDGVEDPAAVLATYKLLLEHMCEALKARQVPTKVVHH